MTAVIRICFFPPSLPSPGAALLFFRLACCTNLGACLGSGLGVWCPLVDAKSILQWGYSSCREHPSRVTLPCDLVESGKKRNVNKKWIMELSERCEVRTKQPPPHPNPHPTKKKSLTNKKTGRKLQKLFGWWCTGGEYGVVSVTTMIQAREAARIM